MESPNSIEIIQPDDFHHHFRDGEVLKDVVAFASRSFKRIIAMPNLKPPVRTLEDAVAYRNRILSHSTNKEFVVMMTLYLTDATSKKDIVEAKKSGIVYACKLYPAGATTNSEFGVTSLGKIKDVLQAMSDVGLPLLVHGEVTDPAVDIFDREQVFIDTILRPLITEYPNLKVVMEHITTQNAVEFVSSCGPNVAATITAHHLLYNRNDLFKGGICPHMYCLPILKRELHRKALVEAATSGNPKFFIGTDSAPHSTANKESACGCAGIFTGHAAVELYAEAFESCGALDRLEAFTSLNGQRFYGIPVNERKLRLVRESWEVPQTFSFGSAVLRPLRAGEAIKWKIVDN